MIFNSNPLKWINNEKLMKIVLINYIWISFNKNPILAKSFNGCYSLYQRFPKRGESPPGGYFSNLGGESLKFFAIKL